MDMALHGRRKNGRIWLHLDAMWRQDDGLDALRRAIVGAYYGCTEVVAKPFDGGNTRRLKSGLPTAVEFYGGLYNPYNQAVSGIVTLPDGSCFDIAALVEERGLSIHGDAQPTPPQQITAPDRLPHSRSGERE